MELTILHFSLIRSDILHRKDLEDRDLNRPLRLQRLYTSTIQGRAAFFEYLKDAVQNYRRRMIIFKVRNLYVVCDTLRNMARRPIIDFPPESFYGVTLLGTRMCVETNFTIIEATILTILQHIIDDNVLACSFLPESSTTITTYKRGVKGWILSCTDNSFQLYNRQRGNTFIFMTRPAEKSGQDIVTSIALQNFSRFVQQVRYSVCYDNVLF